jgi:TonB family protein
MRFRRTLLPIASLICASAWGQNPSLSAPKSDPEPQITQLGQMEPRQSSAGPLSDSTKLEPIKIQKAYYPLAAEKTQLQGEVMVRMHVSETGDVEGVDVISGDPMLAKSAVDAAKKWKFKPFIKDGKPIRVSTKIPFDFAFSEKIMEKGVSADGSTIAGSKPLPSPDSSSRALAAQCFDANQKRVRVAGSISQGLLVHGVAPVYPEDARQARIQGTVVLCATITKDGRVENLKSILGPKQLVPAAIGAVQQWRYQPYLLSGSPVEVETEIQVNFQLSKRR